MIDDLIAKILALPLLALSAASHQEFLQRTNRIRGMSLPLTVKTFNDDLAENKVSHFGRYELQAITAYLHAWREMSLELDSFLVIVNAAWEATQPRRTNEDGKEYVKPMEAGDAIPLCICLIHKHESSYKKLLANLELARDVDEQQYYINLFYSSVTFLLTEDLSQLEDDEFTKFKLLVAILRDDDFYLQLYLQIKLYSICAVRMSDYIKQIYDRLNHHDIHDYDFEYSGKDIEARRDLANTKVHLIHSDIESGKLADFPDLTLPVKKYIAYLEFYTSLKKPGASNFDRLREFAYKFPVFGSFLGNDLEDVRISLSNEMRHYLAIPAERGASLFNLFAAPPDTTLPLNTFMTHLTAKITHMEDAAIAAKNHSSTIALAAGQ